MANKKERTLKTPIDSRNAGIRNERLVMALLREFGPLSQSQICRKAHLGSSTVSYIVGRLRNKNLIVEKPGLGGKRGVRPTVITINPQGRAILAVELSPAYLLIGRFDFNCELLETRKIPLGGDLRFTRVIDTLTDAVVDMLQQANLAQKYVVGLGITISGSVSAGGDVELSSTLGWKNVPLGAELRKRLKCPVHVFTTRVRLLAEIGTNNSAPENLVYLNVANGVGANVIIDGHLLHGATNNCGELGHMIFEADGPLCGCGHRGCLEALIGGPALAEKIKADLSKDSTATVMARTLDSSDSAEDIINKWSAALEQNDPYAIKLQKYISQYLARAAGFVINLYDPDRLILGGYVVRQSPAFFIDRIKEAIVTDVYSGESRHIDIRLAKSARLAHVKGAATAIYQNSMNLS